MRAIWKGYLRCNLVNIPTKMFTAATRQPPQFQLSHKACGSCIIQENLCPPHTAPWNPIKGSSK